MAAATLGLAFPQSSAQTNGILREVYTGIGGGAVSDLTSASKFPNAPDVDAIDPAFEAPVNFADSYGQRMRALVLPPQTGAYTFWISSDDQGVLYLSLDEDPAHKQQIAAVSGWTSSREWTKEAGQKSASIMLTNGVRYYLEALQKEGGGGDNLAVRWQLPSGAMEEPIPGNRLAPYGLGPPVIQTQPAATSVVESETGSFSVRLSRMLGATFQWEHQGTNLPGATAATCVFGPVSLADSGTSFLCRITNNYGSVSSSAATLTVRRDVTPPSISSVGSPGSPTLLTVILSEPVEAASATQAANYAITPGVNVVQAGEGPDARTVLLTTSQMQAGTNYTLTVSHVRDRAAAPNPIAPGASATFAITPVPLPISYLHPPSEKPGPGSRHGGVVISEIMYHPLPRADGLNGEFLELYNSNPFPEDLGGWSLTGEVDFAFPTNTVVPALSYLVVAPSPADLQAIAGFTGAAGGFTNRLANGSGTLRLRNRQGAIVFETTYSGEPPWPAAADGAGHSLILSRPSLGGRDAAAWAASDVRGGSPGRENPAVPNATVTVMFNEFLAHTDPPELDFVELFNYSASPVNLSGCALTDDPLTNRYVFPSGTSLAPMGFLSLDSTQLGFRLNAAGETLYLVSAGGSRVLDALRYAAQENGVPVGRCPDGSPRFSRLQFKTPGAANAPGRAPAVVINELMYDPPSGDADDEFVELHNPGSSPVDLSGWRVSGGVRHTIAPGTVLAPGGYLVLARNAVRLLTNHPGLDPASVQGDYQGSLGNGGDRVALTVPDDLVSTNRLGQWTTNQIHVVVGEVTYGVGGRWGRWAHGGGSSLELVDWRADRRLASSWADSDETAKSGWVTVEKMGLLDHGNDPADSLQLFLLGAGECLVDNVEVIPQQGGTNLVSNGTFEAGMTGWVAQGNQEDSAVEEPGIAGGRCLHLRATGRGDTGANRVRTRLTATIAAAKVVTLRARVRWLAGNPEFLMRLRGNWLEATTNILAARNLGTPGATNSRARANAGPAISDVQHNPVLPRSGQSVRVTARVEDPDQLAILLLRYRVDPATNFATLTMVHNGAGLFSADVPAQATGGLVAFYIEAFDHAAPPMGRRFPEDAPDRECLIRWGEPLPTGNFGTYQLWVSGRNFARWSGREKLSNKPLDCTFVYNGQRVIYNMGAMYSGSPWHAPGFDTPTGNVCDYQFGFPDDDRFLGETDVSMSWPGNGGGDNSYQREQTAYWIADRLGLPYMYRRHVNLFVNGVRRAAFFEDVQQPNGDVVDSWYPGGKNGDLHKVQLWFEFDDAAASFTAVGASLDRFLTTGGAKKLARYRWTWARRAAPDSLNNYTNLFRLVDTVNTSLTGAAYSRQMESTIDVDNWLRTWAVEHIVGNNDSYAYGGGQNMYAYRPVNDTWKMLIWDIDFAFASLPPDSDLFNAGGRNIGPDLTHPPYRRLYWQILQEAAEGPLSAAQANPVLDAKYAAMIAAGQSVENPSGIKNYLAQRRTYILTLIATNATATFKITSVTTNQNLVTFTGTAPLEMRSLTLNGVPWPVTWLSISNWSATAVLANGTNHFDWGGLDRLGSVVPDSTASTQVLSGVVGDLPQNSLRFSEIHCLPAIPDTEFVELFNRSSTTAFDLSGWRIDGLAFSFPDGTVLRPLSFALVARNRVALTVAHGRTLAVTGEYTGTLDPDGETLRLVQPGATAAEDHVVNEVTYRSSFPWPVLSPLAGGSLQLVDDQVDNNRAANWATSNLPLVTPGTPSSVMRSLPQFPMLWLNEYQADNQTGPVDAHSHHHPWVEIYNGGTSSLDLANVYLARQATNLLEWRFPTNATIPAHGFRIVWLDGSPQESSANEWHASVTPPEPGGLLVLSRDLGNSNPQVLDHLQPPPVRTDHTFGSYPDGRIGGRRAFDFATPIAPNNPAYAPVSARINEWQADNAATVADPADGDFEDWFELFNPSDSPADLAGYHLATSLTDPTQFTIPTAATVPPGGFLMVWADGEPGQNSTNRPDLHTNFKLSRAGEAIGLFDPDGNLLDFVTFGPQQTDRTQGRFPDGGDTLFDLAFPSPYGSNLLNTNNQPPILNPIADATVVQGQLFHSTLAATDPDSPAQSLTFSLAPGAPAQMILNPLTGLLTWRPTPANPPGTYTIITRVTDNGTPPLSATRTFHIRVAPPPTLGTVEILPDGELGFSVVAIPGKTYRMEFADTLDHPTWQTITLDTVATAENLQLRAPAPLSGNRFYRIAVVD